MAQTLYASFADAALAEKAAGALLDYGVRQEDISLVANNERGQSQSHGGKHPRQHSPTPPGRARRQRRGPRRG